MPAKPSWYRNLPNILKELAAHPYPYIDRPTVEFLLGVNRRRAQQIMGPCVTLRVGASGLADRNIFAAHLKRLAEQDEADVELARRRKVARFIEDLHRNRLKEPRLLVEAPTRVVSQQFRDLPPGVRLERGRVTIDFTEPHQCLEKLLALAMAISNDLDEFERHVT